MKKVLFLLTLISFVQISSAQYDDWSFSEVYLKDGTVLKGQARIPITQAKSNNPLASKEKLRFRTDSRGSKKIDPKDIEKIIFNVQPDKGVKTKRVVKGPPKTFVIIKKNKKKTKLGFAELIIDGKIKLVKKKVSHTSGNLTQIIRESWLVKGEERAIIFSYPDFKSFKKRAIEYFSSCPSLVKKLEDKFYKRKDLETIVNYFNVNCAK